MSDVCAVCGRPSRYIFAFPAGTAGAGAGVVYDGAPVCSRECAHTLRERQARAQVRATREEGAAGDPGAQEGE